MHLKNGETFAQNASFLLKMSKNFLGRGQSSLPTPSYPSALQVLDPPLDDCTDSKHKKEF